MKSLLWQKNLLLLCKVMFWMSLCSAAFYYPHKMWEVPCHFSISFIHAGVITLPRFMGFICYWMPWSNAKLGFLILPQPGARLCSQIWEVWDMRGCSVHSLIQAGVTQWWPQPAAIDPDVVITGIQGKSDVAWVFEQVRRLKSMKVAGLHPGFGPQSRPWDHSSPYQNHRAPSSPFSW